MSDYKVDIINHLPHIHPEYVGSLPESMEIIDVRSEEEYHSELGHIKGSKLITKGPELEEYLKQCGPDKEILFVCRSGKRSGDMTHYCHNELGMKNTYNMTGGMLLWNQLEFPILR